MSLAVTRLVSGGLVVTYQCPSACAHCFYRGGPGREASYMDQETARAACATALALGATSLHVGGGEPLADPLGLAGVLAAAAETGVPIEYVRTSAAWFEDKAEAVDLLAELRSMGLATLWVAISPMHNAFVPLSKTLGVMEAAREAGVDVELGEEHFLADLRELDPKTVHPFGEYLAHFGPDYAAAILRRAWVPLGGRSFELFAPTLGRRPVAEILAKASADCRAELSDTSHFHMDLYGNYLPGRCAGLAFRLTELGAPLDAERYPILTTLATSGVRGLYDYAVSLEAYEARPEGYVNKCELCQELRRHLCERGWFESCELSPEEFYAGS